MALYTIHAPPRADGAATEPADLVFIKDGFCWPALFIPPIWIVWRRLWLTLLIWIVALFAVGALADLISPSASGLVMVLFFFYFALEANGLRRWTIERRRHRLIGVVEARNLDEAELRYFSATVAKEEIVDTPPPVPALKTPAPPPPVPPAPAQPWRPQAGQTEIVGLFPAPGTGR